MSVFQTAAALMTAVVLAGAPGSVSAQGAPTAPSNAPAQKTIGVPSAPETAKVEPALIVMNAAGAILADNKLTLTGLAPNAVIFADRPTRAAGHELTVHLLEEWGSAADASFAKDPPNATVSAFSKDGSLTRDAVVVLKNPSLQGDKLTFEVQILEGDLSGADGPASVFIDIIGLPFTPLSFAGVARRTAYRAAMYNAATLPPYGYRPPYYPPAYYAPPRCGYYPLPPCY
ncbi:MAG: hypothetical protein JWQ55_4983 [Rhodopila sp.]|jgi:hypothetical protein|nr:hypothetical protein [Rhodopila sp.]